MPSSTVASKAPKLPQDTPETRFGISYLPTPTDKPIEQIKPLSTQKEAILDLADKYAVKHGLTPDRSNLRRLLMAESGISPWAVNKTSGACGLFQRLPCSVKLGDVEGQLDNGMAYIKNRYGTIAIAASFQASHHWY